MPIFHTFSKKSHQGSRDNLVPAQISPNILASKSPQIPKSIDDSLMIARGNMNISYDDTDSVASTNQIVISSSSHATKNSISPKEMKPPARKPYMNTGAIDLHQSEFAVGHHGRSHSGSGAEEILFDDTEDEPEPRYANVGPKGPLAGQLYYSGNNLTNNATSTSLTIGSKKENNDEPIPPYMPMQQQTSKKSTSLEQRIKRKKEKEGCKQQ